MELFEPKHPVAFKTKSAKKEKSETGTEAKPPIEPGQSDNR
jgi:hypothetical protein